MDFSVTYPEDGGTNTVNFTGDSKYGFNPHGLLVVEDADRGEMFTHAPGSWLYIKEAPPAGRRRGLIA